MGLIRVSYFDRTTDISLWKCHNEPGHFSLSLAFLKNYIILKYYFKKKPKNNKQTNKQKFLKNPTTKNITHSAGQTIAGEETSEEIWWTKHLAFLAANIIPKGLFFSYRETKVNVFPMFSAFTVSHFCFGDKNKTVRGMQVLKW